MLLLLALGGLALSWIALGISDEERGWFGGLFARGENRPVRPPRKTVEEREARDAAALPPRSRPAVAVTEPSRAIAPAVKPSPRKGKGGLGQASLALGDNYALPSVELLSP